MSLVDLWTNEVLARGPEQLTTRAVALLLAAMAVDDEVDCSQSELAAALSSTPSTVSRHIGLLEAGGWVEKRYTKHGCVYRLTVPEEDAQAQEVAQAQVSLREKQSDLSQTQSDLPEKQSDLHQRNAPSQTQTDQKENKREKVPPHPPKRENKRKTTPQPRERDVEPHPDRDTSDLSQWILTRLQEHNLEPNTMTPYQILERLRRTDLPSDQWESYLLEDIADKAERVEADELRNGQALKYLGRSDDVADWLGRKSRATATSKRKPKHQHQDSLSRGFFEDVAPEDQRGKPDPRVFTHPEEFANG